MAMNEVVPSPSQVMEGKIDTPTDSPTVELNGLQSGSSLNSLHPPAHKKPELDPTSPTIIGSGSRQFNIPITLQTLDDHRTFPVEATLVDSGVTEAGVIDTNYVSEHRINMVKVAKPIATANADGTPNTGGTIKHYVPFQMKVGSHEETINLLVTRLSSNHVFLGHEWLSLHDPEISWRKKTLRFTRCPPECSPNLSMRSHPCIP